MQSEDCTDREQAEALTRAGAVAAETETDTLWLHGWGYVDLAAVLERAGRIDEAREALRRALALWERKRCLPYVRRVREQIDSLGRERSDHHEREDLQAPTDLLGGF